MNKTSEQIDLLFETSWEVCNKIGGIYTVLSTKAKTLQTLMKDKTIFVGPDVWSAENPSPFFTESKTLLKSWRASASLPDGVSVRVGRWNVPGKPIAVLVKFDGMYAVKDEFYGKMWQLYGVDSLHAYGDYDEACAFSHAAGVVIESIITHSKVHHGNVIAHFDEWTTGMGLLYTKWRMPEVATVFTTHATSIGRSICGNGKPLYDYLKGYNGDQMARELNMEAKHSLEKAAAHNADCFTTVSEITAMECEQLLDIRPHVVTLNGFEKNFVPSGAKFKTSRKAARKLMLDVAGHLVGQKFDDDTFIVTTSGRCEYRNKGIDVYLDSLATLVSMNPERNVLAFVMVPAWCKEPREDLQEALHSSEYARLEEPVITHWLHNMDQDPVLGRIRSIGFGANVNSKVTVIYVPCYLNGTDGVFNMPYYDLLIGMDVTVFPSYYEPWGYTPLESVAFGVPTITTSLSGFGQWVKLTSKASFDVSGVSVVERGDGNYHQVVHSIASDLKHLVEADDSTVKSVALSAMATSDRAAWEYFIEYYQQAYNMALQNALKRNE
ncbi:MAG: glycogen/starch synthase [Paramuribaculum sp.]|nr:glycogen/starch synthase [Paramuribaculum sp.]